ncbi:84221862-a4be-486e-9783-ff8dd5e16a55-CDS [Sclerotinia trifoliorum]|uniref:84221862-a4be-486e-9783-ff8dd5e16a55-CDS n=1 Tax=Sclerotinia trifoliorum TaxID=28548 RepID=A0A8H2W4S9_9HELO|nr:84221862-a4be-486e-9783-ff8dd5e16a55-CDS [Sclerotinia trifoliorum]
MRHDPQSKLRKRIACKDLPTESISILREFYGLSIVSTYVDEVERESTTRDLTRKDMEDIHTHVLYMEESSDVCLYDIICSHEAKTHEVVSYFLEGRPIAPALSVRKLKDTSQANIIWQFICLHNLMEKEQNDLVKRGEDITPQANIDKGIWNTDIEMGVGTEGSEQCGL